MRGTLTCKILESNSLFNPISPGAQIVLRLNRNLMHPPANITADLEYDSMDETPEASAECIAEVVQSTLQLNTETLIHQAIRKIKVALPVGTKLEGSVSLVIGDSVNLSDISSDHDRLHDLGPDFSVFSTHCLNTSDPGFTKRAAALMSSVIISGDHFGQGATYHQPAHALRFLGIRAVIAKSFDPIHKNNLKDAGIMPLEFVRKSDYDKLSLFDELHIEQVDKNLKPLTWIIHNINRQEFYEVTTSD